MMKNYCLLPQSLRDSSLREGAKPQSLRDSASARVAITDDRTTQFCFTKTIEKGIIGIYFFGVNVWKRSKQNPSITHFSR